LETKAGPDWFSLVGTAGAQSWHLMEAGQAHAMQSADQTSRVETLSAHL